MICDLFLQCQFLDAGSDPVHARELWFSPWNYLFSIIKLPPQYKGFLSPRQVCVFTCTTVKIKATTSFYFEELVTNGRHGQFESKGHKNAIAVLTYGLCLRFCSFCSLSSKRHGLRVIYM